MLSGGKVETGPGILRTNGVEMKSTEKLGEATKAHYTYRSLVSRLSGKP